MSSFRALIVRLAMIAAPLAMAAGVNSARSGSSTGEEADIGAPPAVVRTALVEPTTIAQKLTGIANILSPEALIQLDSDIRTAEIAAKFSQRELTRYQSTQSLSLHIIEGAQRQAETAATQLDLLKLRLRQTWGDNSPFLDVDKRKPLIDQLSAGKISLVRLDFPDAMGSLPKNVHVTPLSGGDDTQVSTLWQAPSGNSAMPGVSYFGLITSAPGLRQFDRARAVADKGDARSGTIIPQSALVVFAGETWCYVETAPQTFERRKVPLTWPVASGYLVESGFPVGTKVVVRGASTLLSREAEPGEGDDDDDGRGSDARPHPRPASPMADRPQANDDEAGDDDAGAVEKKQGMREVEADKYPPKIGVRTESALTAGPTTGSTGRTPAE